MKILKNILDFLKVKKKKLERLKKLNFNDLFRRLSGTNDWIQSELIHYADPHDFTNEFRRRVRVKYNNQWHRGRFRLWKKWDKKDSDKFFIVETRSKRKMLIPKDKVYFKQKHKKWTPAPHNDYFEIYTILMYIKGNIKEYEELYKKWKNKINKK